MTFNCQEIIDDDVETIVYCPRSFIESDSYARFNSSFSKKLDNKNKSNEKIANGKKSSFTDIRNAIFTRVNSPRGRQRSKTLVERRDIQNSDVETLKKTLGRTSSLDVLRNNHNKRSTNDLTTGFSELTDKTLTGSTRDQQISIPGAEDGKSAIFFKSGKDRSNSCPTYPVIFEEKMKRSKKLSKYKSSTCSINESQVCSSFAHPTIKVEHCSNEHPATKTDPLQRKLSTKATSKISINSDHTESSGSFSSSDDLSICISQVSAQNTTISKATVNVTIDKTAEKGDQVERSEGKRPKSFIDIFRREKDFSANCNTSPLPRKCNKQDDDEKNEKYSVTLESENEENVYRRSRSPSLIELSENTIKDKNASNDRHRVKKTSSNIYGLASSTSLKKLFKKKKRVDDPTLKKNNPPASAISPMTGQRKCVKIESLV